MRLLGLHPVQDLAAPARGQGRGPTGQPASGGLHADQARQQGIDVATAEVSLPDAIARPRTYEKDPRGDLGLVADRHTGHLVGAWAVAPQASEWIHQAAQAIRAQIPISTLLDGVAQFPTYSEAYLAGLEKLDL